MPKKKRRMTHMRFRKNDPTHNLLAATQHWIKAHGGNAIVIGGIGLMQEPFDKLRYKIVVSAMGRAPVKPDPAVSNGERRDG